MSDQIERSGPEWGLAADEADLRRQLAAAQAERDKARAACAAYRIAIESIGEWAFDDMSGLCDGETRASVIAEATSMLASPDPGKPLLDRLAKAEGDFASVSGAAKILAEDLATAQSELAAAQAACAEWQEAVDAIRDRVLNERDAMAEMDFGNDRVNAVLSIIDDVMPCAPLGQPLLDRLAKAEATIAKLPKYADTGKPFVPGRDKAWVVIDDEAHQVREAYWKDGRWTYFDGLDEAWEAYSEQEAAALAAKEADNG